MTGPLDTLKEWINNQESRASTYLTYQVHKGNVYSVSHLSTGILHNANYDVLFIMQDDNGRMGCELDVGGDALFYLYEEPTIAGSGTALAVRNLNRESANMSDTLVFYNPNISAEGTLLQEFFIPGGSGNKGGQGGHIQQEAEWLFASHKSYLLRLVNVSGDTDKFSFKLGFYVE